MKFIGSSVSVDSGKVSVSVDSGKVSLDVNEEIPALPDLKGGRATEPDISGDVGCYGDINKEIYPVIHIYKPVSSTPKEMVQILKEKFTIYQNDPKNPRKKLKIGYAGRLDPMARGVLLLLTGEENKNRKTYEFLDKQYIFELALGFQTDTYDILGLANDIKYKESKFKGEELEKNFKLLLESEIGTQIQQYPPYSSVRVNGRLLFEWAKENRLSELSIPSKTITIFSLTLEKTYTLLLSDFIDSIHTKIANISSNNDNKFRQSEILKKWNEILTTNGGNTELVVLRVKAHVSHGAYVRSIGNTLGEKLGVGGVVIDLLRTKVGNFDVDQALKL